MLQQLLLLLILGILGEGGKILILHPIYTGSHVLTLRTLSEELVTRGHHVTIVKWKDSHGDMEPFPNITMITLAIDNSNNTFPFLTVEPQAKFQVPAQLLWDAGDKLTSIPLEGLILSEAHCIALLSNKKLQDHVHKEEYDIALVDLLYNECSLAFTHHLGIPSVGYWAFSLSGGESDFSTAPSPVTFIPMMTSTYTDNMSFYQRIHNIYLKSFSIVVTLAQCYVVNSVVQQYLPGTPHPIQLLADLNGMLINTDNSFDYPRALPPTFVNVGGLQIREKRPLPKNILDFIEGSGPHGVILFTMGYIFHSSVVPQQLVTSFMDAFSRLPQRVLVKFDVPINHTLPNVKVVNFLPQQDVLEHPKTRVFLTHCGMHGMMEAIYFGVPVVGMPIFLDQVDSLTRIKQKGIGVGIRKDATAKEIYKALKEVLDNPRYQNNINAMSSEMRYSHMKPREKAAWLLEYLIHHKGANHLRLASRNLNIVQYFGLDIIAFIIFSICIAYIIVKNCHSKRVK